MERYERAARLITLGLFAFIMVSLSISAIGALVKTPALAYFWFLALVGILSLILLSAVLATIFVVNRCIAWYRRQIRL